jgi:hypothetical protein
LEPHIALAPAEAFAATAVLARADPADIAEAYTRYGLPPIVAEALALHPIRAPIVLPDVPRVALPPVQIELDFPTDVRLSQPFIVRAKLTIHEQGIGRVAVEVSRDAAFSLHGPRQLSFVFAPYSPPIDIAFSLVPLRTGILRLPAVAVQVHKAGTRNAGILEVDHYRPLVSVLP